MLMLKQTWEEEAKETPSQCDGTGTLRSRLFVGQA